jgi:hypothetical protein
MTASSASKSLKSDNKYETANFCAFPGDFCEFSTQTCSRERFPLGTRQ